jgi:hypothetical protein
MATPGSIKRFNDAVCEVEGIKVQCPQCGTALIRCRISYEEMPENLANFPYQYCQSCDIYYISWEDIDDRYQ